MRELLGAIPGGQWVAESNGTRAARARARLQLRPRLPSFNAPEVAILGASRLARKPVWDGEAFVPRGTLPLSLSYDHRAINGAEAGRFMTWLCQALGDIRRLLL